MAQEEIQDKTKLVKDTESEEIITYKKEFVSEKVLDIPTEETSYAKNLGEAEFIKVTLDNDSIIQRVSRDMYANPISGLRELFTNEARACRTAIREGFKPEIVVTMNKSERKLIIHGVNSMGMSEKRFREVYTVLGKSDNLDGSENGQFGLGRVAYLKLSEEIKIDIFSRVTNELYSVMGKGGVGYQKLPIPKMDTFGTRCTMTVYEDINFGMLVDSLIDISRFSKVKTILILEDDIDARVSRTSSVIRLHGKYPIAPFEPKEYLTKLRDAEAVSIIEKKYTIEDYWMEIDHEDFSFIGYIGDYDNGFAYEKMHLPLRERNLYLAGVPIQGSITPIVNFSGYLINIKDERKYMPASDRERLTEKAVAEIQELLNDEITKKIKEIKIRNIQEYTTSPYKIFLRHERLLTEKVEKSMDRSTVSFKEFLYSTVQVNKSRKDQAQIINLLRNIDKVFWNGTYKVSYLNGLRTVVPEAILIKPYKAQGEESSVDPEEQIENFEKFGLIPAKAFIKEKQIKAIGDPTATVTVHFNTISTRDIGSSTVKVLSKNTEKILIEEVEDDVIKTADSDKLESLLYCLSRLDNSYRVFKSAKNTEDAGIELEEFVNGITAKEVFFTNQGKKTIAQIVEYDGNPLLIPFELKEVTEKLTQDLDGKDYRLAISGTGNEIFEVACARIQNGKTFEIDEIGEKGCDAWIPNKSFSQLVNYPSTRVAHHIRKIYGIINALYSIKDDMLRGLVKSTFNSYNSRFTDVEDITFITKLLNETPELQGLPEGISTFYKIDKILLQKKKEVEAGKSDNKYSQESSIKEVIDECKSLIDKKFNDLPIDERMEVIENDILGDLKKFNIRMVKVGKNSAKIQLKQEISKFDRVKIPYELIKRVQSRLGYNHEVSDIELIQLKDHIVVNIPIKQRGDDDDSEE